MKPAKQPQCRGLGSPSESCTSFGSIGATRSDGCARVLRDRRDAVGLGTGSRLRLLRPPLRYSPRAQNPSSPYRPSAQIRRQGPARTTAPIQWSELLLRPSRCARLPASIRSDSARCRWDRDPLWSARHGRPTDTAGSRSPDPGFRPPAVARPPRRTSSHAPPGLAGQRREIQHRAPSGLATIPAPARIPGRMRAHS